VAHETLAQSINESSVLELMAQSVVTSERKGCRTKLEGWQSIVISISVCLSVFLCPT